MGFISQQEQNLRHALKNINSEIERSEWFFANGPQSINQTVADPHRTIAQTGLNLLRSHRDYLEMQIQQRRRPLGGFFR